MSNAKVVSPATHVSQPTAGASPAAAVHGHIIIMKDGQDRTSFPMSTRKCLLGRSLNCDIRIQRPTVSSEHAIITIDDAGLAWIANTSDNGLAVNGRFLPKLDSTTGAPSPAVRLADRDIFVISERVFRFQYPARKLEPVCEPEESKENAFPASALNLQALSIKPSLAMTATPRTPKKELLKEALDTLTLAACCPAAPIIEPVPVSPVLMSDKEKSTMKQELICSLTPVAPAACADLPSANHIQSHKDDLVTSLTLPSPLSTNKPQRPRTPLSARTLFVVQEKTQSGKTDISEPKQSTPKRQLFSVQDMQEPSATTSKTDPNLSGTLRIISPFVVRTIEFSEPEKPAHLEPAPVPMTPQDVSPERFISHQIQFKSFTSAKAENTPTKLAFPKVSSSLVLSAAKVQLKMPLIDDSHASSEPAAPLAEKDTLCASNTALDGNMLAPAGACATPVVEKADMPSFPLPLPEPPMLAGLETSTLLQTLLVPAQTSTVTTPIRSKEADSILKPVLLASPARLTVQPIDTTKETEATPAQLETASIEAQDSRLQTTATPSKPASAAKRPAPAPSSPSSRTMSPELARLIESNRIQSSQPATLKPTALPSAKRTLTEASSGNLVTATKTPSKLQKQVIVTPDGKEIQLDTANESAKKRLDDSPLGGKGTSQQSLLTQATEQLIFQSPVSGTIFLANGTTITPASDTLSHHLCAANDAVTASQPSNEKSIVIDLAHPIVETTKTPSHLSSYHLASSSSPSTALAPEGSPPGTKTLFESPASAKSASVTREAMELDFIIATHHSSPDADGMSIIAPLSASRSDAFHVPDVQRSLDMTGSSVSESIPLSSSKNSQIMEIELNAKPLATEAEPLLLEAWAATSTPKLAASPSAPTATTPTRAIKLASSLSPSSTLPSPAFDQATERSSSPHQRATAPSPKAGSPKAAPTCTQMEQSQSERQLSPFFAIKNEESVFASEIGEKVPVTAEKKSARAQGRGRTRGTLKHEPEECENIAGQGKHTEQTAIQDTVEPRACDKPTIAETVPAKRTTRVTRATRVAGLASASMPAPEQELSVAAVAGPTRRKRAAAEPASTPKLKLEPGPESKAESGPTKAAISRKRATVQPAVVAVATSELLPTAVPAPTKTAKQSKRITRATPVFIEPASLSIKVADRRTTRGRSATLRPEEQPSKMPVKNAQSNRQLDKQTTAATRSTRSTAAATSKQTAPKTKADIMPAELPTEPKRVMRVRKAENEPKDKAIAAKVPAKRARAATTAAAKESEPTVPEPPAKRSKKQQTPTARMTTRSKTKH